MVMLMNSNLVIQRQKQFVDQISDLYEYDNNIRHLLYVIIPAFIIKYGVSKEKMIQNAFRDIRIVISNEKDKYVKAYYSSKLKFEKGEYKYVYSFDLKRDPKDPKETAQRVYCRTSTDTDWPCSR